MKGIVLIAALTCVGAVGCTTVPADIAADYETLNANIQKLGPKYEAHVTAVIASETDAAAQIEEQHNLVLSAATRLLADKLNTWVENHSNKADVAAIQSARGQASTPSTVKKGN